MTARQILTIAQVADRLGVHVSTVRAWVRDQKIPSYRVGERFVRLDWAQVVETLRCPARDELRALSDSLTGAHRPTFRDLQALTVQRARRQARKSPGGG